MQKLFPDGLALHQDEQLKGDTNVTLKLASGRKTTAPVNRLKPYHQKNMPEVQVEEFTEDQDPEDNEDVTTTQVPQLPPRQQFPQPPPPPLISTKQVKQQIIQPQLIRRQSPRLGNVSALENVPRLKILTGEGVQKVEVQKTLISQTRDKQSWIALITEANDYATRDC